MAKDANHYEDLAVVLLRSKPDVKGKSRTPSITMLQ